MSTNHFSNPGNRWIWVSSCFISAGVNVRVVPGARDSESAEAVVTDFRRRTEGRIMDLMISDDYPAYETAILQAYGQEVVVTPTGRPSRRLTPVKVPPPGLNYATVEKRLETGRVVEILLRFTLELRTVHKT